MSMGGGGGGGGTNTQTVQTVRIPQFLEDATLEAVNRARGLADQPYVPYTGQTIAELTPQQLTGIQYGSAVAQDPNIANAVNGYANVAGRESSYVPQVTELAPGQIAPWMSPYIEQALKPQITAIQRQGATTAKTINAGATGAGAFGDARTGVEAGLNDRNILEAVSNATGTGYQSAYDRAMASAQAAGQLRLGIGQLGLAGSQNRQAAAQLGAGLTAQQYALQSQEAKDLLSYGKVGQDQTQASLSQAFQDYVNQREYPKEGLNLLLAAIQGVPYSSTRLTTTPYNSTAANLGLLTSLIGLGGKLTSSSNA